MLKKFAKIIVVTISWRIAKKLLVKKDIKIVAVVGSVGKSSTKRAIAQVLAKKYRVAWQDGNYNDIVSVPLVFFGLTMPSLFNPLAWIRIFIEMNTRVANYSKDVVVLELGTDSPGQIAQFSKYLQVDIAVVTPIAPEHMEFFASLEEVAKEELTIQDFAKEIIVFEQTRIVFDDDVVPNAKTYGCLDTSTSFVDFEGDIAVIKTDKMFYEFKPAVIGLHQVINLSAACLVAEMLDLDKDLIVRGLASIRPMPGRMQKLKGIKDCIIIDDTYNSSPASVEAALDAIAQIKVSGKKIAVLGNMNELGDSAKELHLQIGTLCTPKLLDLLVTIGAEANKYLAGQAEKNGCKVIRSNSPYEIGEILLEEITQDSLILLKGSQNGVFLEEAIKPILASQADRKKLVRQSRTWIKKKQEFFA